MKLSEHAVAIATTFTLACLLAPAITTGMAQAQSQPNQQPPDSVVAVVADAMSLPFVPPDQRPVFGTFWEVHSSLPCLGAPLPFPPMDTNAPVYAIGDPVGGGQFLVDLTAGQVISPQAQYNRRALSSMTTASIVQAQADELQTFVAQVQARQAYAELHPTDQMGRLSLEGGGVFGPMAFSYTAEDLWLEMVTVTNATGFLVVHPPETEATTGVYDLLMTSTLSADGPGLNLTNWYWLLRTSLGDTNLIVPDLPAAQAYFRLARTNDADGDGLSDAIELLVTHTDPNTPDPNPFPVIVSQPLSQTVFEGDSVTFTVQANGLLPLSYQWQFTAPGLATTNLTGATDPSLTLNNISPTAAGTYSVLVFNLLGSAVSSNAVLTVTNSGEFATVLVGPRQDYRFKGDKTYYVDGTAGPVDLYGATTIEGGAVVKYATNAGATLVIRGSLVCQTTPWRPAIFTAADDDMLGWPILSSSGTPTNFYAPIALDVNSSQNIALKHVRITYAQTAIHYSGDPSRDVLGTLRHAQILHCAAGLVSDGITNHPCQIDVANVLFSDVGKAITGARFRGSANHLTVDHCDTFVSDTTSSALGFFVTNSVFGDTTSLGDGAGLDGSNNGFYTDHTPPFGTGGASDDQSPFAPTGGVDGQGNPFLYIVNGQGAYYLRDGSPFTGAGTTNVASSLKNDFAQMTTTVPPDLLSDDINSSTTIGPTAIRDPNAAALGYHYPVVDHVLMLATVNNATLNIEPGTVLALVGYPYWWANWGIRLNPGGRLNVNGLPTNHVIFAHLEGVQESPVGDLAPDGPMLNWRNLGFFSGLAAPYPEVRLHYADFPTISAGCNAHLCSLDYDPESYSIISNLELDGCLLQGGWFVYDDGGPAGRKFTLRNTVFDRCEVWMLDGGAYEYYFQASACSAQVTAANNLFHQCFMALRPVEGSSSWSFTDNIFDYVTFYSNYDQWFLNSPISTNHHNVYVGMSIVPNGGGRLTPAAPTTTDPDLPSLSYESGPLGMFYLPTAAANLLAKGSRSAAAAGEYHFASRTNSVKEAAGQVSIGPHYLGLASGGVPDANGDGVPDFLADRNGNGTEETNEVPWQTTNATSLVILSPAQNSTVSGLVLLRINPGTNALAIRSVCPLADGSVPTRSLAVKDPAGSLAEVEIDTRYLEDGQHALSVAYSLPDADGLRSAFSPPVVLAVTNAARQPHPERTAGQSLAVNMEVPPSVTNYTIWFFNSGYPKAPDPFAPWIQTSYTEGSPTNGAITYSETTANLGFGDGNTDPNIYSLTELADAAGEGSGSAVANANTRQFTPWPSVVSPGWWAAAYADNLVDFKDLDFTLNGTPVVSWSLIADKNSYNINPLTLAYNDPWYHGVQLGSGWRLCGPLSGTAVTIAADPSPSNPALAQTWPLRLGRKQTFPSTKGTGPHPQDKYQLLAWLSSPIVRNFYGAGHGNPSLFLDLGTGDYAENIRHRYRFVFLDGCETALGGLLGAFGATDTELALPVYPPSDVQPPPALPIDINYYYATGFRPGAFVGWKATPYNCFANNHVLDDRTGQECELECYEALCNWHSQFLASWAFGRTLLQAIGDANSLAFGIFADPPTRYMTLEIPQPDGSTVTAFFTPETCLKVFGYGDIKFNEYNHATDWAQ